MFTTVTKTGAEVLINPAHVAAVLHNADECRVELCTGQTYFTPPGEWPIIRAALNGAGDGSTDQGIKTFKLLYAPRT